MPVDSTSLGDLQSLHLATLLGTAVHAFACNPVQICVSSLGTGDGSSANSAYETVQQAATRLAFIFQSSPGSSTSCGRTVFFVENSLLLLDQPGEWYLDEQDGLLNYKPVNNKDPNTSDIILLHLDVLVSIGGFNYKQPGHDIKFHNVTFAHTTWNAPSSKYGFPDQ